MLPLGRMWEDTMKICCEERGWMELAQDRAHWWALVLPVLNLRILLSESLLDSWLLKNTKFTTKRKM
jgi:hypothetical protein